MSILDSGALMLAPVLQADGTLEHVVDDLAVLESMLSPVSGAEPKEKDDLVGVFPHPTFS